jgi:O-acetyl-ADP-ribose deacetylase (regulator of RNase III)
VHEFVVRLSFAGGRILDFAGPTDITKETTEAIVNAANSSLLGGGGVDGAIHRAGGPSILVECKSIVAKIGRLPAGRAVLTTGGRLPAKYVIHTVGPVYARGDRGEAQTLASCYRESISLANDHAIASVAFPSISTGAFGYPVHDAALVAVEAVAKALESSTHLKQARFALFDAGTVRAYTTAAEKLHQAGTIAPIKIEKASS